MFSVVVVKMAQVVNVHHFKSELVVWSRPLVLLLSQGGNHSVCKALDFLLKGGVLQHLNSHNEDLGQAEALEQVLKEINITNNLT